MVTLLRREQLDYKWPELSYLLSDVRVIYMVTLLSDLLSDQSSSLELHGELLLSDQSNELCYMVTFVTWWEVTRASYLVTELAIHGDVTKWLTKWPEQLELHGELHGDLTVLSY